MDWERLKIKLAKKLLKITSIVVIGAFLLTTVFVDLAWAKPDSFLRQSAVRETSKVQSKLLRAIWELESELSEEEIRAFIKNTRDSIKRKITKGEAYTVWNKGGAAQDDIAIQHREGEAKFIRDIIAEFQIPGDDFNLVIIEGVEHLNYIPVKFRQIGRAGTNPERRSIYIGEGDYKLFKQNPSLFAEFLNHEKGHLDHPEWTEEEVERVYSTANVRQAATMKGIKQAAAGIPFSPLAQIPELPGTKGIVIEEEWVDPTIRERKIEILAVLGIKNPKKGIWSLFMDNHSLKELQSPEVKNEIMEIIEKISFMQKLGIEEPESNIMYCSLIDKYSLEELHSAKVLKKILKGIYAGETELKIDPWGWSDFERKVFGETSEILEKHTKEGKVITYKDIIDKLDKGESLSDEEVILIGFLNIMHTKTAFWQGIKHSQKEHAEIQKLLSELPGIQFAIDEEWAKGSEEPFLPDTQISFYQKAWGFASIILFPLTIIASIFGGSATDVADNSNKDLAKQTDLFKGLDVSESLSDFSSFLLAVDLPSLIPVTTAAEEDSIVDVGGMNYYSGAGWASMSVDQQVDCSGYEMLKLKVKGEKGGGEIIIQLLDKNTEANFPSGLSSIHTLIEGWQEIEIPLSEFRPQDLSSIWRIAIHHGGDVFGKELNSGQTAQIEIESIKFSEREITPSPTPTPTPEIVESTPTAKEDLVIDISQMKDYSGANWASKSVDEQIDCSGYETLKLKVKGEKGGEEIIIQLLDKNKKADSPRGLSSIHTLIEGWQEIEIFLSEFRGLDPSSIWRVAIHHGGDAFGKELNSGQTAQIEIESIKFSEREITPSPTPKPTPEPVEPTPTPEPAPVEPTPAEIPALTIVTPIEQLQIEQQLRWLRENTASATGLPISHVGDPLIGHWGFTYDASIVAQAYMVTGVTERAKETIDYYIEHKGIWSKGGIINAVDVTSPWEDGRGTQWVVHTGPNVHLGMASYQISSNKTGIGAYQVYQTTGEVKYLDFAKDRADFAISLQNRNTKDINYGGIRMGPKGDPTDPADQRLGDDPNAPSWYEIYSTEHIIDAWTLFNMVYQVTDEAYYKATRDLALRWLKEVGYNKEEHRFNRGYKEGGYKDEPAGIDTVFASDTQFWGISALGVELLDTFEPERKLTESHVAEKIMQVAEKRALVTKMYTKPDGTKVEITGFDFVDHETAKRLGREPDISPEWTYQAANAYLRIANDLTNLGEKNKAEEYLRKRNNLIENMRVLGTVIDGNKLALPYSTLPNSPTGHGWNTPAEGTFSSIGNAYGILATLGYDPLIPGGGEGVKKFNLSPEGEDIPSITGEAIATKSPTAVKTTTEDYIQDAWQGWNTGDWQKAVDEIEAMIKEHPDWLEVAKRQNEALEKRGGYIQYNGANAEDIFNYWAVNDIGVGYFILVRGYDELGEHEKAVEAAVEILTNYNNAQCWDPQGWFWQPVISLRKEHPQIYKEAKIKTEGEVSDALTIILLQKLLRHRNGKRAITADKKAGLLRKYKERTKIKAEVSAFESSMDRLRKKALDEYSSKAKELEGAIVKDKFLAPKTLVLYSELLLEYGGAIDFQDGLEILLKNNALDKVILYAEDPVYNEIMEGFIEEVKEKIKPELEIVKKTKEELGLEDNVTEVNEINALIGEKENIFCIIKGVTKEKEALDDLSKKRGIPIVVFEEGPVSFTQILQRSLTAQEGIINVPPIDTQDIQGEFEGYKRTLRVLSGGA